MERITSRKNPRIVHMKKLGTSREYRNETGEFICDGIKLLREAVMHRAEITCVLFAGEMPEGIPAGTDVFQVDMGIIEAVSPMKNPQPVLFSCRKKAVSEEVRGAVVILEGVQDPGNVGTMLRTANAMGVGTVVLTGGCADPYNPKTVRASMGAVFRQHYFETDLSGVASLRSGGLRIMGAALGEGCRPVTEVNFENAAVVIGSEGRGISAEMLDICDERVIIPMAPECESLNAGVAAAIIMWEMCGKWQR